MGLLCFVLDLPSLPPLLLNDVKRTLLHVANLCATTKLKLPPSSSRIISMNLAVCCVDMASVSEAYELHIIYKPVESLNLRDFHHAVASLFPSTMVNICSGQGQVSSLSTLLQLKDGLLSWGPQHSGKKIIMISSLFAESTASFRQTLMKAADQCISIDFIQVSSDQSLLEIGSHEQGLPDLAINVGEFENCTFQQVAWDPWQFMSLEKKWVQDLVNDVQGPMEMILTFQEKLYRDRDKVLCSLRPLLLQIADSIQPCQTCRCHGAVLDTGITQRTEGSQVLCPYTGHNLDNHDLTSNGVKVGVQTVLYLPSFKSPLEPAKFFTSPMPSLVFTVIKCIPLNTLSEGLLFGDPFIVMPSSEVDLDDDVDNLEINDSVFASLCQVLYSQDCGLLCTSSSDIDMLMEKSFSCYYLLLPAENRSFLAKRIAASEEFLQLSLPELKNEDISMEVRDSVSSCLSKIAVQSYNPVNHERGLHSKLNWLAKESLQFSPLSAQRPHSGKSGQPHLIHRKSSFNNSVERKTSELSFGMGSKHNDIRISEGSISTASYSSKGQAGGAHQDVMPKQAAPKPTPSAEASSPSFGQLSLKPLLPLQTCPKPSQNQTINVQTQTTSSRLNQKHTQSSKPTLEPVVLKANFRRIKQGKV